MSEPSDKSEPAESAMTRPVGPRPPDELAYESVATLARARIRRRELSPVEVLDHFIARIEALDSKLNSVVVREFDEARERARAAEQKVRSGSNLGPLHGVPLALKDLFSFKPGWRNTFGGVRAMKDYVATSWSMFPERAEQAGAIILGKTNSPVFGFRGATDNYLFGPTHNPFNLSKNSGGSSVAAPPRWRRACCPSRKAEMAAKRSAFPQPGAGLRFQALVRPRAGACVPERLWGRRILPFSKGRSLEASRTQR